MSIVKNNRISIADQTVDQKKWDEAPYWKNLEKRKNRELENRSGKKV